VSKFTGGATHRRRRPGGIPARAGSEVGDGELGVYPGHRAEPLQWLGWPVVRWSDEAAAAHGALPNNGGRHGGVQEGARGQLKAEAGSGHACLG
jgi:hypothetical protein